MAAENRHGVFIRKTDFHSTTPQGDGEAPNPRVTRLSRGFFFLISVDLVDENQRKLATSLEATHGDEKFLTIRRLPQSHQTP